MQLHLFEQNPPAPKRVTMPFDDRDRLRLADMWLRWRASYATIAFCMGRPQSQVWREAINLGLPNHYAELTADMEPGKMRRCLTCRRLFYSPHCGVRMCDEDRENARQMAA